MLRRSIEEMVSEMPEKSRAKYRLYFEIMDRFDDGVTWMANVILTGCGKPTKRLKALVSRLDAGHEIGPMPYMMPYDGFLMDGVCVRFEILDDPSGTVEQYRYEPQASPAADPVLCGMN